MRARAIGAGRGWRWCRRTPLLAGMATAGAVLLVLAALSAGIAAVQYRAKAALETQARLVQEEHFYHTSIAVAMLS